MSEQSPFQRLVPQITENARLREPQCEAYAAISEHFSDPEKHREAGIVLPVGCGKSGLITIAPFGVLARTCVPQVRIGVVTRSGPSLQVRVAAAGDGEPDAIVTRLAYQEPFLK